MSKEPLKQVDRSFTVKIDIAVKPTPTTDVGLGQDVMDVVGTALGAFIGTLFGGGFPTGILVDVAAETLFRSHWYSPAVRTFPLIDWEPCNGRWNGTVTFERHRQWHTGTEPPRTQGAGTDVNEVEYQSAHVTATTNELVNPLNGDIFALLDMPVEATFSFGRHDQVDGYAMGVQDQWELCSRSQGTSLTNLAGRRTPNQGLVVVVNSTGKHTIEVPMTGMAGTMSIASSSFTRRGCNGIGVHDDRFSVVSNREPSVPAEALAST